MENSHYQEHLLTHVPIDEAIVLQAHLYSFAEIMKHTCTV